MQQVPCMQQVPHLPPISDYSYAAGTSYMPNTSYAPSTSYAAKYILSSKYFVCNKYLRWLVLFFSCSDFRTGDVNVWIKSYMAPDAVFSFKSCPRASSDRDRLKHIDWNNH